MIKILTLIFIICVYSFQIDGFLLDISHLYKGHDVNGFLPFGTKYGDIHMLKNDDGYEGPMIMPFDFPFFKNNYTKFYINTNGLISFEQPLADYYEILSPKHNISYISPFWTDIDTRYNGDIYHREIKDTQTIDSINKEINLYVNSLIENFKLKYAYLVTWLRAEPYPRYNEFVDNTFQVALITDGQFSFIFFNYHNLTWPNRVIRKNLQIGYCDANDANNCFIFRNYADLEFQLNKTNGALKSLESESNREKSGKWILRIDQRDEALEQPFLVSLDQRPYVLASTYPSFKKTTKNMNSPSASKLSNLNQSSKKESYKAYPSHVNYGEEFGDRKLPRVDDGYTGPLNIPNEKFKSFFINTNGIISFDHQLSYSGEITTQQNVSRFIAPLWTDIDTSRVGEIFQKEIKDKSLLLNLKHEISDYEFDPKWAYEITWSGVNPYMSKHKTINTNLLSNSFQCIISTGNSTNSPLYVIFNYFSLSWPSRTFTKNLVVGYSIDHRNNALIKNFEYNKDFSLEYSMKKSDEIIAKLLNESNCGRPGKWIFRLDVKDEKLNKKFTAQKTN